MSTWGYSALTVVLLMLLGGYIVHQARRSRESELAFRLTKCQIALDDAERSLQNTHDYYKGEVARLKTRLGELEAGAPASDRKFRAAKSAFARLYHPDGQRPGTAEAKARAEVFKEFWAELQRIETGR